MSIAPSGRLDRNVLWLWRIVGLLATVAVSVLGFGVAVGVGLSPVLPTLVLIGSLGATVLVPSLMYRRWRYEIRERDLLTSKGAWWLVRTLIPFDRIQFVETRQGPLDSLFGLNQVVVYTAAGRAGRIPGLAVREAEELRNELSRVAGTTVV